MSAADKRLQHAPGSQAKLCGNVATEGSRRAGKAQRLPVNLNRLRFLERGQSSFLPLSCFRENHVSRRLPCGTWEHESCGARNGTPPECDRPVPSPAQTENWLRGLCLKRNPQAFNHPCGTSVVGFWTLPGARPLPYEPPAKLPGTRASASGPRGGSPRGAPSAPGK